MDQAWLETIPAAA